MLLKQSYLNKILNSRIALEFILKGSLLIVTTYIKGEIPFQWMLALFSHESPLYSIQNLAKPKTQKTMF